MGISKAYFVGHRDIITTNVPLLLKVRDFMFFRRGIHINSHFEGFFEGAETFLTSKLS
jgi:hypothetical protein